MQFALAAIAGVIVLVLATGSDKRLSELVGRRRRNKKPPKWQRALRPGTAKVAFVLGALLSFPGASYLAGLDRASKLQYSTIITVLIVIGFNLVMFILIEIPILAFAIWPRQTPSAVDRAEAWAGFIGRHTPRAARALIAAALAIRATAELLR